MKVRLLKAKTAYGIEHKPGEELVVRPEIGTKWIKAKEAEAVESEKKSKSKKKK